MVAQLNLVLWAWLEACKDAARLRLWRPFLFLALVQIAVVLLLTQFYRPGLSTWLSPLLERLTGPGALHYPQFYVALPAIFSQINLLIDWLVGSLCIGVAFVVIWTRAAGRSETPAWGLGRRRWIGLVLVRFPLVALLFLLAWVFPRLLFPEGAEPTGAQIRMLRYATFLLGVLIESLFVYAPMFLLLEGRSVVRAWKDGLAFLARAPLASLLVVLVPNLLQLPTSWVLRRGDQIVENLSPELVAGLVVAAIFVYVVVNFFIVGSALRLYGARGDNPGAGLSWT